MDEGKSSIELQDEAIASFRVWVTSVEDATWQGVADAGGLQYHFQSELQLLRWIMEQFPVLRPDVAWETDQEKDKY